MACRGGGRAESAENVGGGAAGGEGDGNATGDAEIAAGTLLEGADAECLAGGDGEWLGDGVGGRGGAGEGDAGAVGEGEGTAEEGHFQGGRIVGVAEKAVAEAQGEGVGGTGAGDSVDAMAGAAEVLNGGEQAGGVDEEGHGRGWKVMVSPGWRRLMGVLAALKSSIGPRRRASRR